MPTANQLIFVFSIFVQILLESKAHVILMTEDGMNTTNPSAAHMKTERSFEDDMCKYYNYDCEGCVKASDCDFCLSSQMCISTFSYCLEDDIVVVVCPEDTAKTIIIIVVVVVVIVVILKVLILYCIFKRRRSVKSGMVISRQNPLSTTQSPMATLGSNQPPESQISTNHPPYYPTQNKF